jgi:hypothetical protein
MQQAVVSTQPIVLVIARAAVNAQAELPDHHPWSAAGAQQRNAAASVSTT